MAVAGRGVGRGRAPSQLTRADLYHDGAGFRLMELNIGSTVGGLSSLLGGVLIWLGVAGDIAAKAAAGPGSLAVGILDALHRLDAPALITHARVT